MCCPSEGAEPPEEERVATLPSAEGPTSYRLVGVAASDPAVGFKSPSRHQVLLDQELRWFPLFLSPSDCMSQSRRALDSNFEKVGSGLLTLRLPCTRSGNEDDDGEG